jgi:hypothetical protein
VAAVLLWRVRVKPDSGDLVTGPVQIARDGFARASLMRERWQGERPCGWCGGRGRFVYWWQGDGLRAAGYSGATFAPERGGKLFCSVGCWRLYAGDAAY